MTYRNIFLMALFIFVCPVISKSADLRKYDFSKIDEHALRAPVGVDKSVETLASYLKGPATNDLEKTRAIYRWITANIRYDTKRFFRGNITSESASPETVLHTRLGVCAGYANLFKKLGDLSGLQVVKIDGYAKGIDNAPLTVKDPTNHSWNAVKLEGNWYLIDSTWGAGKVGDDKKFKKDFDEHYFLVPPDQLINSHFPEDPSWQLLRNKVSKDAFLKHIQPQSLFYKYNLALDSHFQSQIITNDNLKVTLFTPADITFLSIIYQGGKELKRTLTRAQLSGNKVHIDAHFPKAGKYLLRILAKPITEEGSYHQVLEYDVTAKSGMGESAGFAKTYSKFDTLGLVLQSHFAPVIRTGSELDVSLSSPDDIIFLSILYQSGKELSRNLTRVRRAGNMVHIEAQFPKSGEYELKVFAKKDYDQGNYTSVLEYEVIAEEGKGKFAGFVKTWGAFEKLGLSIKSHESPIIQTESKLSISILSPPSIEFLAILYQNEQELNRNLTRVRTSGNQVNIDMQFPKAGKYNLKLYAKRKSDQGNYDSVLEYEIHAGTGKGKTAGFVITGPAFDNYDLKLDSHTQPLIVSGRQLNVSIFAPSDIKIMARINKNDVELGADQALVNYQNGRAIIQSSFPGQGKYSLKIYARKGEAAGRYDYVMEYDILVK